MSTWLEMVEFDGIDLSESYVLGWSRSSDDLVFELYAVLVPGHRDYRVPLPDEWACYRRATLTFPAVRNIEGLLPQDAIIPAIDATGELDYGNIDLLEESEGRFHLRGEFGEVRFHSGRPRFSLRESGTSRAGA